MATKPVEASPCTVDDMIVGYVKSTFDAANLLYSNNHLGQLLIVIYSAMDTMGLLDAPPTVISATGASFQNWVKKYFLPQDGSFEFDEQDLWGARCGVLHTYTAESDKSRAGKLREVQYIAGDKESDAMKNFFAAVRAIDGGNKHVGANIDDMFAAFGKALMQASQDLANNCASNPAYAERLRKVLQSHYLPS